MVAGVAAIAALVVLVTAPAASAQSTRNCGYGSGGPSASSLCWFDMSAYTDSDARDADGQQMSIAIPGGYTASFTLTSRAVASTTHPTVAARTTPLEDRFAFGSSGADGGYRDVPGKPALYSQPAVGATKGVVLTLSNIQVVDSAGQQVTGYRFAIADAENNVAGEDFTWTSDKPLDLIGILNDDAPAGCNAGVPLAGLGTTTVVCDGSGGEPGPPEPRYDAVVVGADTPSTIGLSMTTFAQSGVAFAIQTSKVEVRKAVDGRSRPSDSFDVLATSPEGSQVGRATTGSGGSATTGELTVLPRSSGASYTLADLATPGSGTQLNEYRQRWSCTNNGSAYAPTGPLDATSVTVSPVAGDDIECTVTNTSLPAVSCTSDPNFFNTGYNAATGGVLSNGSNDPSWEVAGPFYTPTGTTPASQALPPPADASFGPPVVGNQAPGFWSPSPYGNAQWISQPGTGGSNGDWYYRLRFVLDPAVDPETFSLSMKFLADNAVAEVYVNGEAQSGKTTGLPQNTTNPYTYPGFQLPRAAQTTLEDDWQTGANTIVVQIKSFATAEGFLAQIVPSSVCPVDLGITKSASPDPYTPGQSLTYTVEVTNGGPGTAGGLSVTDPLPSQLAGGGFSWTCAATSGSSCAPSGSGSINDVPAGSYPGPRVLPGGKLTYTLTGTVPETTSGTVSNTATLTPAAGTQDPGCTPSCSATTETRNVPLSDLELTKSADPAITDPGEQVTYTLTATNNGPDPEPEATVTDTLPPGVAYVSDDGDCDTLSLPQLTCDLGAIDDGDSRTVHVTVSARMSAADSTQTNAASVDGQNLDLEPDNNEAEAHVFVRPVADLEIEKTADPAIANPNDEVTYALVVTNNGPDDSPSAEVTDTLPDGVTYADDDGDCTTSLPQITCALGPIPNGESRTIQVDVTVDGDAGGTVQTNAATVTGPRTDPDPENNSDEADVLVLPLSDLSVTKTAPATVRAGQELTYTLAWANNGPSDSPSPTTITDTLPAGVSHVENTGGCTVASATITCSLGAVPDGANGTIQITVAVDPATRGEIENTASIDGPNNDQESDNDSDTARTQVDPQLTDLAIEKSVSPETADPGGTATYTITVTNNGPDDSPSATVTDTLPSGLRYESDDATCDTDDLPKITCELGAIANGDTASVEIETSVSQGARGSFQDNSAKVTTEAGTDSNPDNDAATARLLVPPLSDLTLTKEASANRVEAGRELTYTLNYANAGPNDSPDPTTIIDTLPDGLTHVSDDANCDASNPPQISCPLGSVADGETGAIRVTVRVARSASGPIQNQAEIDGPNNDPEPSDNGDSAGTEVEPFRAPTGDSGKRCFFGNVVTILGTNEAERIVGTPGRDVILGRRGDDVILGMEGDDLICGGRGKDLIKGGLGDDRVKGSLGDDRIVGGRGNDWLRGAPGDDLLKGKRGDDRLMGNNGDDRLRGGRGSDFLLGGPGLDWAQGSHGADRSKGVERAFGVGRP